MPLHTQKISEAVESVFIFFETKVLVKTDNRDFPSLDVFQQLQQNEEISFWIYEDTYNYVATFVNEEEFLVEGYEFIPLVQIFSNNTNITPIISRARSLVLWRSEMHFCSHCGSKLSDAIDETAVDCLKCSKRRYPAFSPAIIVLIRKDDKVLLAKHANRGHNFHTCLAGYLEQGETLEECVKREVFEEVALQVKNVKYIKSQSWPFPNQIMFGFICDWESGEIKVDKNELEYAAWYKKDSLPEIPYKGTIANFLITSIFD